jgi:hypothetical protein
MRYNPFIAAATLAMIMAFGLALRIFSQDRGFLNVVKESLATTDGYDQKFIDLVNHLEKEMAIRASFGYPGGKDPMTGRRREMANLSDAPSMAKVATTSKSSGKKATVKPAEEDSLKAPPPTLDKVKLTAIIADDYGQHTAIVMNGERSQSVDAGDMVGNRKVTKISSKELIMEDETGVYSYDLSGNRSFQQK